MAPLTVGGPPPPSPASPCVGRERLSVPTHSSQFLPLVRGVSEAERACTPCPSTCCEGPRPLKFFVLKVAVTASASDGPAWEVSLRNMPCERDLESGQQDSLEVSPGPGAGQAYGSQSSEEVGEGSAGTCRPRPGPLPTGPEVLGYRSPLGSDLGSLTRLLHAFTRCLHFLPLPC